MENKGNIPAIEYKSVLDALRGAADKYGDGAYTELSFAIPKDKWPMVKAYLSKHTKNELL